MTDALRNRLFPLPYAHWYAATLFLDAGHPAAEVLHRLGIGAEDWAACTRRYGYLHFPHTRWVARAFEQEGLAAPEDDQALFAHLTAGDGLDLLAEAPFSMRRALAARRRAVEARPQTGPFAGVAWTAHYLCERTFPPILYVHNGTDVCVEGAPLVDRKGVPLAGVDPHSFRQLGERWFRDARRVYGQGETATKRFWFVVRHADPDSFTALNEDYAADKDAGYHIANRRLPTEEPGTFEIVSYVYGRGRHPGVRVETSAHAKDSRTVYADGIAIDGADAATFQAIGDEGVYFADRHRIYWHGRPIPDADRATFTCVAGLGQYRAYDRNGPYHAGAPESVTARFELWRPYFEARPEITESWWHSEKARRDAAATARPAAPVPLGGPYFSDGDRLLVRPQDRRRAKSEWVSLDHIDHATFRHITDVFGHDSQGLRYVMPGLETHGLAAVTGADPATFRRLSARWFVDARQAYYFPTDQPRPGLVVVKADIATFEILGGAYARDAKGLIVEGKRKRGIADPAAVAALGFAFARMGGDILYHGKVVSRIGKIDPMTARGLTDQFLIDADGHMLIHGSYRKPIRGLDPPTLTALNDDFLADARRVYGITDHGLMVCEEIDREQVEPCDRRLVRTQDARFHILDGTLHRTTLVPAED